MQLLDLKTASMRLGLSESCLRSWVAKKRIRFTRLGRAVRFDERVLEDLVREGTVVPPQTGSSEQMVSKKR